MKLSSCLLAAVVTARCRLRADAFSLLSLRSLAADVPQRPPLRSSAPVASSAAAAVEEPSSPAVARVDAPRKTRTLGLLTFDLDDSLYPIEPVLHDANEAFVEAMTNYGYPLEPQDIVEAGKRIREEAGPVAGTAMSHTEVRLGAIRREMERKMLEKKLRECAEDWATEVESLTGPVRRSAERWAASAVSETVVEAIYSAWERERHHSAERHLYPEVIGALERIKEEHPDAIVGAVTDGKANPMLMVFSLAPYFDFCLSWEDDGAGRTEFFKELGDADGNADLQWIYKAAFEKYQEIADAQREMKKLKGGNDEASASVASDDDDDDAPVWIHVGDDLAYDVGGSASCGARTILLDLDDEYGQTAKARFGPDAKYPAWNTASEGEIARRAAMNEAAEGMVDRRVSRLSVLPDAVDEILKEA
ncbi:hypothetical protein ACHAWF_015201 [Thalassiosira exigua]